MNDCELVYPLANRQIAHLDREAFGALGEIEQLLAFSKLSIPQVGKGVFVGEEGFAVMDDVLCLGDNPLVNREEEVIPLTSKAKAAVTNYHSVEEPGGHEDVASIGAPKLEVVELPKSLGNTKYILYAI